MTVPLLRAARHPFTWAAIASAAAMTALALYEPGFDRVDEPLPSFELQALDGHRISSASLLGRPWVVALWMPGCSACQADLEAFNAARADFERQGVGFLAVSIVEEPAVVREAATALGLPAPVTSVGDLLRPLRVTGVPSAVFIDARGRIVGRVPGGRRSASFFRLRAAELLSARRASS